VESCEAAQVEVLCTQGDRVVLQYREAFFGGGPRFHTYDWRRVLVDLGAWEGQAHDMGWVLTETPWPEPPDAEVHEEHGDGDSLSIVESLASWGMPTCFFGGEGPPGTGLSGDEYFRFELSDAGLTIGLGGRTRPIEDFAIVLPGAVDPPGRECLHLLGNVRFAPTQPWPDVDQECTAEAERERPLDRPMAPLDELSIDQALLGAEHVETLESVELYSKTLVIVLVRGEYHEVPLLVAFDTEALRSDKSYLINAMGFDAHKRGDYERSRTAFERAAQWDRENQTARYNLACACARLKDTEGMVQSLSMLPATAELRAKIEADADFDGVREKHFYQKFMDSLPHE